MVSSQVHSQHSSHISFPSMRQHRSWVPNNADVCCQELETSEAFGLSNTTPDGHLLSSNRYACPGHANMTSPLNSSWIQRLIPSQNTRVEQPQPSDKLDRDNYGINGLQTNWYESADHLRNHSDIPVYENSRRSKQNFYSSHKVCCGTKPLVPCVGNAVNIRCFEAPDAQPPEIQVLPKPLPVVESLLPGCSEKARENQIFSETIMPHVLSRCTGFAKPMNQMVHYSADKKSRVSCSSIGALNRRSVVCAAGDSLALKALQQGKRCIDPLQPCSEFSFNSSDAVTPNFDTIYSGKDKQRGTNLRTYKNSTQTEDSFATLHSEGRLLDSRKRWASFVPSCQAAENGLFDGYSTPNNCWSSKKRSGHAHDGSEALYAREGSFNGGWWSFPYRKKDELRQISNLVPLQCGSNVAKEKAGIYLPHQIEQDLDSSHEEQGGTSKSFSFHFENRLAPEDYSKVVMRKGQWPFGPSTLSSQDLGQSRWSEDNRATDATTPGIPHDNSFSFQEPGVHEAGTDCIVRSQSSPFFGTEKLNDSSSCRVFNNHDILPYKASCIDIGGVHRGQMKIEALPAAGADHTMQTLKGRHPLSRLESNSMIEGVEGKEAMQSFPLFKLSSQCSTPTCPPEGAQSNHAEGNCASVNHSQTHRLPIRDNNYLCLCESTQLNNADGNPCSIGSCSKRPSNPCSEDTSTSADARSQPFAPEKPVYLQEQLPSPQRQRAATKVYSTSGDRESTGKEATSWEVSGAGTKENVWMKRWSTLKKSRKVQALSRPIREGVVLADTTHARNYFEGPYSSQTNGEFSGRFDVRPAKRICMEERSRPHPELGNAVSGLVAVGKEHNNHAAASHFMKRFFTPSVGAMAIMGMTARKVSATKLQKSGLFGIWASNASLRKPSGARVEVCKEFATIVNCKKDISQSRQRPLLLE